MGENRDSTRIVLAETAQTRAITEYHGRPVGNGVIVLPEGAVDCVISGPVSYTHLDVYKRQWLMYSVIDPLTDYVNSDI